MLDGVVAPPATETSAKRKPAGRVVLHVGAPKTGTTYLQNVLWHNRTALAEDGVLYPLKRPLEHFDATMDIRGMEWEGARRPEWDGAWKRLTARVRRWSGPTAVVSNEILGGANVEQIKRVVDSLRPAEVAVVFTARDLARQLPSSWRENLKHRLRVTFERFVDDLIALGHDAPDPWGEMFWSLHHPIEVLARWEKVVPRENIHVVTVPQPGAPQELLWNRFAQVLGIDGRDYDAEVAGANSSFGVAQAELLRRVNAALPDEALGRHSDPLIRVALGENILVRASENAPSVKLPAPRLAWVTEWSQQLIDGLRDAEYDVVGDLAELMPMPHETPPPQPEDVSAAELLDPAISTITGLLERLASERDEVARLRYRLDKPFKAWLTRRHPRVADYGRRTLDRGRRHREFRTGR
ncbi:MAG: hypothetical protein ACRDSK_12370 [Actinophytocola sp.]|uniref:hypothetical protein n=1 Tax=Actinophytocola sp. TaxID=1872138 RepID=UPI003D6C52E0